MRGGRRTARTQQAEAAAVGATEGRGLDGRRVGARVGVRACEGGTERALDRRTAFVFLFFDYILSSFQFVPVLLPRLLCTMCYAPSLRRHWPWAPVCFWAFRHSRKPRSCRSRSRGRLSVMSPSVFSPSRKAVQTARFALASQPFPGGSSPPPQKQSNLNSRLVSNFSGASSICCRGVALFCAHMYSAFRRQLLFSGVPKLCSAARGDTGLASQPDTQ